MDGGENAAMVIEVTVQGEPVAQGRPRFTKVGNFVQTYTPKKTKDYHKLVAAAAHEAMQGREALDGALDVSIMVYKGIPKSWSKIKKQDAVDGLILPAVKPDIDNYVKAILDGLSYGNVWLDDSQVVRIKADKKYSENPRADIIIREVF